MSTRSDIIVHLANDSWARVYCHNDGYPSHNGVILAEHYASQGLAEALIKLGDLSTLAETIGTKHPFDWYEKLYAKYREAPDFKAMREDPVYVRFSRMCKAYGRDRGEKDTGAAIGDSLPGVWPGEDSDTEYAYVWSRAHGAPDGAWYIGFPSEGSQCLKPLPEAIAADAIGSALEHHGLDWAEGYRVALDWLGRVYIEHEGAIHLLRKTRAQFEYWKRKRPHAQRAYGSFSGDHDSCAVLRLSTLWKRQQAKGAEGLSLTQ